MFSYDPSGSGLTLGSSLDFDIQYNYLKEFSWTVEGVFEKFLESYWNTGDGVYYWYRVQGLCGKMECDEFGVSYPNCKSMTFFTVVPARNISELCEVLSSPKINAPVNLRISSVHRHSRPVFKDLIIDEECNVLEEEEICHIPECLDYCVEENAIERVKFDMSVIEAIYQIETSGGIQISGSGDTPTKKSYQPIFPIVLISGIGTFSVSLNFVPDSSISIYSEDLDVISSSRSFDGSGFLQTSGSAVVSSSSRSHQPSGGLLLSGGIGPKKFFYSIGGFNTSGSAEVSFDGRFVHSVLISVSGQAQDVISPGRFFASNSSIYISGSAERNFESIGVIDEYFSFLMSAFDFKSDLSELSYLDSLTISEGSASACGCSPISLSLTARHNLSNSSVISNFIRRNAISLAPELTMHYRTSDSSWRGAQRLLGTGRDGSSEEWLIIFSITCINQIWRIYFSTRSMNMSTREIIESKFIIDTPSFVICDDNNIASTIRLDVGSSGVSTLNGRQILVVEETKEGHTGGRDIKPLGERGVEISTDGFVNDYVVYYDNLGLFKDSYWSSFPFAMTISPASNTEMPTLNLSKIFE